MNYINIKLNSSLLKYKEEAHLSKRLYRILVITLVLLSIGIWAFYKSQGLTLAYNDARSRLDISRRIIDNLQPGFAQVGSVWLPLFHILELPLVWNNTLWQSGFAGSYIAMTSYVLGGVYLIKLLQKMNFSRVFILFSFAIYALNPNLLFMQSLPLTESLLIFLAMASCYYLFLWSEDFKPINLILGAFFVLLSSLTRYDGWFLLLFATIFVGYVSYKNKKFTYSLGNLILFLTLSSLGVVLWLLWNQLIFKDAFYFALGPFSAKAQQDILLAEGRLFSKGNMVYSIFLYILTVLYNTGIWIGIVSFIGFVLLLLSKNVRKNIKFIVILLSVPFIFNVLSLYLGHSVIHLPYIAPFTWFNDRYGLMMLPALAITFAFVISKTKLTIVMGILIIIFQLGYMYYGNDIITIDDGIRGSSGIFLNNAGNWLKENAKDGLILTATSSNDALVFTSGIPLKRFIVEGTRMYWEDSLSDPTRYATWIVMKKGDLVEKNLNKNSKFLNNFSLVYKDSFAYIYKIDKSKIVPLTQEELP